jgi:hypothetical protein
LFADVIMTVVSLLIGAVSVIVTLYLYAKTRDSQKDTDDLIENITGLFAASQRVGILTAYENRERALLNTGQTGQQTTGHRRSGSYQAFVSRLETERKLIVVGSSLLGLKMYVDHLPEIVAGRVAAGLETKFMMTHPCYSGLRESQEGRSEGQIRNEIDNMISQLEGFGLDLNTSLRFYKGTPTCFAIITTEAMLLNPYPYQIEAFRSFCIEVRRLPQNIVRAGRSKGKKLPIPQQIAPKYRPEFEQLLLRSEESIYDYRLNVGSDIYGQFYWYHYLLPWFSRQIVTYREFLELCLNQHNRCPCLADGFSRKECRLPIADDKGPKDGGSANKAPEG